MNWYCCMHTNEEMNFANSLRSMSSRLQPVKKKKKKKKKL